MGLVSSPPCPSYLPHNEKPPHEAGPLLPFLQDSNIYLYTPYQNALGNIGE